MSSAKKFATFLTVLILLFWLTGCDTFISGKIVATAYTQANEDHPAKYEFVVKDVSNDLNCQMEVSEDVYREYSIGDSYMDPFAGKDC